MSAALMNGLFNGSVKGKTARSAVRVGNYGLRAIEVELNQD